MTKTIEYTPLTTTTDLMGTVTETWALEQRRYHGQGKPEKRTSQAFKTRREAMVMFEHFPRDVKWGAWVANVG